MGIFLRDDIFIFLIKTKIFNWPQKFRRKSVLGYSIGYSLSKNMINILFLHMHVLLNINNIDTSKTQQK